MHNDLLARIEKLEAEMYKRNFWERPAPPPVEYPETTAINPQFYDAGSGIVSILYSYECPVCGDYSENETLRVPSSTANPFARLVQHKDHQIKVVFKRDHRL